MTIAAEIRRANVKDPSAVDPNDFKIKFKERDQSPAPTKGEEENQEPEYLDPVNKLYRIPKPLTKKDILEAHKASRLATLRKSGKRPDNKRT